MTSLQTLPKVGLVKCLWSIKARLQQSAPCLCVKDSRQISLTVLTIIFTADNPFFGRLFDFTDVLELFTDPFKQKLTNETCEALLLFVLSDLRANKICLIWGSKSYKIAAVLKRKAISDPRVANDDLMPTEWRARKNKKSLETIPFWLKNHEISPLTYTVGNFRMI